MRHAIFETASLTDQTRRRSVTESQSNLLRLLSSRRRTQGLKNSGFTLVELMVVIVIVGVLSAVAIPNFMNQTRKAKFTEAKSNMAATIKQAQAQYMEDGTTQTTQPNLTTYYKTPANGTTKFNYSAAFGGTANPIYTITATPNGTDASLSATTDILKSCVNFNTGLVDMQSLPEDAQPSCV